MAVIAGLVAARGSNMKMYVANLLPLSLMTCARFLLGDSFSDMMMGAAAPFVALQMWFTGRPLVLRMGEDARLRFKVEDLARELEETRDEALKKRFEAEAANASKTAFLANMSHELRTPLNAILGFSEIIAQECFGPVGSERYRDYAGDIHASGAHLLSLINDLLDVAKIEAGRMDLASRVLDAGRTFDVALKLVGSKARDKNQALEIVVEPGAPPLYGDERAIKQILINLVSNAVKFTPLGGRIEVVGGRASNGDFQITVRDNGPGIPRDKLDNIFQPFNQVDNRFDRQAGGTGLGLALVRGLAQLHGGRAWVESEYGRGCSVFVTLPAEPVGQTAQVAEQSQRQRKRPGFRPAFSFRPDLSRSDRIVHLELNRMRRVLEGIHFFHLELDVALDEVLAEHVALLQELVVGLQAVQRLAQLPQTCGTFASSSGGRA